MRQGTREISGEGRRRIEGSSKADTELDGIDGGGRSRGGGGVELREERVGVPQEAGDGGRGDVERRRVGGEKLASFGRETQRVSPHG